MADGSWGVKTMDSAHAPVSNRHPLQAARMARPERVTTPLPRSARRALKGPLQPLKGLVIPRPPAEPGEFVSEDPGEGLNPERQAAYTSSPTARIKARALLFCTTPGRRRKSKRIRASWS